MLMLRTQILAYLIAGGIFFFTLELVRRRKLKEEYAWLWLLTSFILVLLTFRYEILVAVADLIGYVMPTAALFFFALIFLMLVCIHFSVKISKLTDQVKNLSQELTLLKEEVKVSKELSDNPDKPEPK